MRASIVVPFDDLAAETMVSWAGAEPHLVGTACTSCGQLMLGRRFACSRCTSTAVEPTSLASSGIVYSWTNVHVFPGRTEPVLVGYVDLEDGVRVFGRLVDVSAAAIGAPVALTVEGDEWWFERVPDAARSKTGGHA